jgi:hypothetical protein
LRHEHHVELKHLPTCDSKLAPLELVRAISSAFVKAEGSSASANRALIFPPKYGSARSKSFARALSSIDPVCAA